MARTSYKKSGDPGLQSSAERDGRESDQVDVFVSDNALLVIFSFFRRGTRLSSAMHGLEPPYVLRIFVGKRVTVALS